MHPSALVWDERLMWYDQGSFGRFAPPDAYLQPYPHVESRESKQRIVDLLRATGLWQRFHAITPTAADEAAILRVHRPGYVELLKRLSAEVGGHAGGRTWIGPGGFGIACLAAGAAIAAVDAVLDDVSRTAYALARPPGHHAEPDTAMGFCLLNNVAIAAAHALACGIERVAVVDWDAHHGNGTEKIFWTDGRVLTISLHQDGAFPAASGSIEAVGEGDGTGCNINVPLPPGSGDGTYLAAMERIVLPALSRFRPQLILVASGFDAAAYDPMARMMLSGEAFRRMTRLVLAAATENCGGRCAFVHEGGYNPIMTPYAALPLFEELVGFRSDVVDVFSPPSDGPWQQLQPHQETAIERVRARHRL